MRSYGQYCSIAKALDVIGDRWAMLIIRELLIRGPCRYTDLKNGLPGIATNLLSSRIRELDTAAAPDLVLHGDPQVILALFSGYLTTADAADLGLGTSGDASVLQRVLPEPVAAS